MEQFSVLVGIPVKSMFAVQNYTNININNKSDSDVLILNTLRHIIETGDDFLMRLNDQEDS